MADSQGWKERRIAVVGGAGFIGSHFVDSLLASPPVESVTVFDNFSSGREEHLLAHRSDSRLHVVRGEVGDLSALRTALQNQDLVVHLASNPDIAKAMEDPSVDFWQGTHLTFNVVEAMRQAGVTNLLYPSGSGVYGDLGSLEVDENFGPLIPISTYGASKLAGEALIASYCHMFGFRARAFRFANVVGPRQTHGVGLDFVNRLRQDPRRLRILGDGTQSKSYVHVLDIVEAVRVAHYREPAVFRAFNVATGDAITVSEIASVAIESVGLGRDAVKICYTGGDRGWKGDVPVVRLNCDRIRALGWRPTMGSREAIARSIHEILQGVQVS
jgi:UDP-glucose 4-epimerase